MTWKWNENQHKWVSEHWIYIHREWMEREEKCSVWVKYEFGRALKVSTLWSYDAFAFYWRKNIQWTYFSVVKAMRKIFMNYVTHQELICCFDSKFCMFMNFTSYDVATDMIFCQLKIILEEIFFLMKVSPKN